MQKRHEQQVDKHVQKQKSQGKSQGFSEAPMSSSVSQPCHDGFLSFSGSGWPCVTSWIAPKPLGCVPPLPLQAGWGEGPLSDQRDLGQCPCNASSSLAHPHLTAAAAPRPLLPTPSLSALCRPASS